MKKAFFFVIFGILLPSFSFATLPLNKLVPSITLSGNAGGHLDGKPWSSSELKGKVHLIFYVDPDAADMNNAASEAVKAENFSRDTYQSIAIINLAATWLPNFLLESKLKSKQEQYPTTLYLMDKNKSFVNRWNLKDDSSDVLVLDKSGKVIFSVDGRLNKEQIDSLLQSIRDHLKDAI